MENCCVSTVVETNIDNSVSYTALQATNLLIRARFMPFKYKRSLIFGVFMAQVIRRQWFIFIGRHRFNDRSYVKMKKWFVNAFNFSKIEWKILPGLGYGLSRCVVLCFRFLYCRFSLRPLQLLATSTSRLILAPAVTE